MFRERLIAEAIRITGVEKPTSIQQITKWLEAEEDITVGNLRKDNIPHLIKKCDGIKAKRVLLLRQMLSKTSIKKFDSMLACRCSDGRIRGLLQFCGANRTWRWAGRLVQVQNLTKSPYKTKHKDDLMDFAREAVKRGDIEWLETIFGPLSYTISGLIRTAFIPTKGKRFGVSDFSAIEARVLAWLADVKWRLEVFKGDGKIYEATAARMFHVPAESIEKGSKHRDVGKVADLACGYQGSVPALINMCTTNQIAVWGKDDIDLAEKIATGQKYMFEDELQPIIDAWREENPEIVNLWYSMQRAAISAVKTGERVPIPKGGYFVMKNGFLLMFLPSGHALSYAEAHLVQEPDKYDRLRDKLMYWGMDQTTKQWCKQSTYGGKLVENYVQAIARDCLANGLMNLDEADYATVLHIHDEAVCDLEEHQTLEEMNELMIRPAPWMKGLPMNAEGFEGYYYKKD